MKKILLTFGLVVSLFGVDKMLSHDKVIKIIKSTPMGSQLLDQEKSKKVTLSGVQKADFYIIIVSGDKGKANLMVSKDLKYTFLGPVLDNKTTKPIKAVFKKDAKKIKNGVLFSFGKGKKDIYVITDPECPWCRKFEEAAKNSNFSKNYRAHIILHPLSFHKNAKAMSYYILSAKTEQEKVKRFHETLAGSEAYKKFKPTKAQKMALDNELVKANNATNELDVPGVPSFFDENFNEIPDRDKLLK